MGGLVIEEIRPGVSFVPDAARAFRRANAQVRAEFGRDIDVNSTYRSRSTQLAMYNAWQAYVNGRGPYPGHSKALHPDDPLAFHVAGTAVDSDDWRVRRIVAILAENGFIRNRLYVKNEDHHFEWIRSRDQHYGEPIPTGAGSSSTSPEEDDMSAKAEQQIQDLYNAVFGPLSGGIQKMSWKTPDGMREAYYGLLDISLRNQALIIGMSTAMAALATAKGVDPEAITAAVEKAVKDAMGDVTFTPKITN